MFDNTCQCCGTRMEGSDHCPSCFCEEHEERCEWPDNLPFNDRSLSTEQDTEVEW